MREEFLVGRVEAGTLLGFGRQERVGGDVEKSRPALPEGAWNLRDAQMTKRKGTGILFAEMDGGIDFTGKLLQGVRGTRSRGFHGDACVWEIASGNTDGRTDLHDGTAQAGLDGLFELFVCVHVNGMAFRGHGSHCVFAEVETRLGDRLFRLPVRDAEVALFVLVRFFARGDEAKTLGPAQGHIVEGEFGGVAVVGEPAFALAYEEDGVTGVFDDVAAIAKIQGKGFARGKRLGEENTDGILAAVTQLLRGEALVLEKGERRAGLEGDGFDLQGARELDEEELFAAGDRTEIDGGIPIEGVVRVDGGVDVVPQRGEGNLRRRIAGQTSRNSRRCIARRLPTKRGCPVMKFSPRISSARTSNGPVTTPSIPAWKKCRGAEENSSNRMRREWEGLRRATLDSQAAAKEESGEGWRPAR